MLHVHGFLHCTSNPFHMLAQHMALLQSTFGALPQGTILMTFYQALLRHGCSSKCVGLTFKQMSIKDYNPMALNLCFVSFCICAIQAGCPRGKGVTAIPNHYCNEFAQCCKQKECRLSALITSMSCNKNVLRQSQPAF